MKKAGIGFLIIIIILLILGIQKVFIQFPPEKGLVGGSTIYRSASGKVFGCSALPPEFVPKECSKIVCLGRVCFLESN